MKRIKESISKVIRITAIIVLIKVLSAFHAIAQLTFVENISIPDVSVNNNYASGIYDIISANGLFFAYAGDKVIVLNGTGDSVIKIFQFPDTIRFVIYNVDDYGNPDEYYEYNGKSILDSLSHYRDINICDFEFNRPGFPEPPDYLYIAKFNEIEIWELSDNSSVPPNMIDSIVVPNNIYGADSVSGEPMNYKFGRMMYIEDNHKIITLPYRFRQNQLVEPDSIPPLIYVLDAYDPVGNLATIAAPNQRIYDAEFIPSTQHLVISYSAHPDDIVFSDDSVSDIARSHFNGTSFSSFTTISTNDPNNPPKPGIDINSSTHLTNINGQILISKKDEVLKLINTVTTFNFSTIISAENNFFGNGASGDNTIGLIINHIGGKIEQFTVDNGSVNHTPTEHRYYPVYHAVANQDGTRICFFNKLNYKKSGFYIYEPDEASPLLTHISDFVSPVGDCIYNPFKDEFLISQNENFGSNAACIVSPDFTNNYNLVEVISLPVDPSNDVYYQNPTKMYIDPNGILYILANSTVGDISSPENPSILTYDATTYNHINSYKLEEFSAGNLNTAAEYYIAHFCYSRSDTSTYFTVTPQEISFPPYNSEYNSMTGGLPNTGFLFSIHDGILSVEANGNSFNNPGKIICPDDGNDEYVSVNENQLFFISDVLRTYALDSKETAFSSQKVNDIVYSPYHDKVFAFADESLDGTCTTDRTVVVYQVTGGFNISFEQITGGIYAGQLSSLFFNPYNNRLYLQTKFDNLKLGDSPSKLIELNIEDGTNNATVAEIDLWNDTYTQNRSFYSELDHCPDFGYYMYNLTTPVIGPDPYKSEMYLPNGGFSNVSKVNFAANESLLLNNETWTWLSVPRMDRSFNNSVSINTVFSESNLGVGDFIENTELRNLPNGESDEINNIYTYQNMWSQTDPLQDIQSTWGYKLKLVYPPDYIPPDRKWLFMQGSMYDHFEAGCPDCSFDLDNSNTHKFWVGYYYPFAQDVLDAMPDEFEADISMIKGQYFTCRNEGLNQDGSVSWVCGISKYGTAIDYGDMVEIRTNGYISDFYWDTPGTNPNDQDKEETEYYSFSETADYTPIFIELDTTENPIEIGAFVNDSCIGASVVLADDSMVLVPAYTDSLNGEIYFEQHFGSSKSLPSPILDYFVEDTKSKTHVQRMIHTTEEQDYFVVSFKNKTAKQGKQAAEALISCNPNPVNTTGRISVFIPDEGIVEIKLYSIMGRYQSTLYSGQISKGTHEIMFSAVNEKGNTLNNGTYIISLQSAAYNAQAKVVILKLTSKPPTNSTS